jgi:hypothetical protein
MLRAGVAIGLVLLVCGPTAALAQQPGQGPPMPIAVDLAKVPPGSWADYAVTMGELPPMKMRMALVARSAAGNVIESSVDGGMMAMVGKMVMQMTLTPGADHKLKKAVMQLGANDPMEMPVAMTGNKPFTKPNPKGLLGSETIKTAAGSFKTKHYRDKTPQGDQVEYWVNEGVPPFGLVKVEVDQKNNPQIKGKSTFQVTAIGNDAKPSVTKPAKPFDQAALMRQMMGTAAGGAGKGGGPKPAPAPGPAPGAAPAPKK